MSRLLLDSDIIIWYLRGREDVVMAIKEMQKRGTVQCSVVSLTEVLLGIKKGEEGITNDFLDALEAYPVSREIACLAGYLIKENKEKGVILEIPDAIIAATCLVNNLILITYNQKHYKGIKGLQMYFE